MPKTSVLIVDDHEAIRRTLRVRIEALPEFSVCGEAVNGVEAVEKAQLLNPSLVILDFAMPEMNGLEAATALRFMLPKTKLYLLTAHSNRELELAARDAGIDAVYSKYEDLTTLFRQLKLDSVVSEASAEAAKAESETSRATAAARGSLGHHSAYIAPAEGNSPNARASPAITITQSNFCGSFDDRRARFIPARSCTIPVATTTPNSTTAPIIISIANCFTLC